MTEILSMRTLEINPNPQQLERFWSRVSKNGPTPDQTNPHYAGLSQCWEWLAGGVAGYGRINIGKKEILAHRLSYTIYLGHIPRGQHILHRCDNRKCVNPAHMLLGTIQDNITDAANKGRMTGARGEKNGAFTKPESRARGARNGATTHPEKIRKGSNHGRAKLTEEIVLNLREQFKTILPIKVNLEPLSSQYGVHWNVLKWAITKKTWKHI